MGTSLFNTTPQATYPSLLKFGDNLPLSSTLKALSDGNGNDTMLELSTTALQIGGSTGMYWNNTTKRLGVGTNAPISPLNIQSDTSNVGILSITTSGGGSDRFEVWNSNSVATPVWNIGIPNPDTRIVMFSNITLRANGTTAAAFDSNQASFGSISGARLGVKGTGSTSATTSLLVQNSAGTETLKVTDDGAATISSRVITSIAQLNYINTFNNAYSVLQTNPATGNAKFFQFVSVGTTSDPVASAALEVVSTTKGFLPPRMTNAQRAAIATPAVGLMVYCTDAVEGLYIYKSTGWTFVI